jgi:peptidoglycan/xylan/chitin deacetylase (PgdA/CDA1 family)
VRRRFRPLVLCYHRVSSSEPHRLAVSAEQIDQHLRALVRRGFRSVPAEELVASDDKVLHVTFDDGFRSVLNALPVLERHAAHATVFYCSGPLAIPELAEPAAAAPNEFATLTWDEVRELADRGVEIGSHTVSHPRLTQLDDVGLERELRESRERIADELGRPCRYLAYPYGDEDERVRAATRRAGYEAAFAVRARPDRFAIPRVDLYWRDRGVRAALKLR